MPKAYSYVRFSTDKQEWGDSDRRQTAAARRWVDEQQRKGNDVTLDESLTFRDAGVSAFRGKNANVEAGGKLGAFLAAVRAGDVSQGSYLLVENLDRISRSAARRAASILGEICDEGITVVTLNDGQEYTSESLDDFGFIYAVLGFLRANDESKTKARRLREVWAAKRATVKDRPLTRVCPGWLRYDDELQKFVTIRERAKIVKRIFRETLKGHGQNRIAENLNADKVPTFGASQFWRRAYVKTILENPAAMGTFVPKTTDESEGRRKRYPQERVDNYFPAVIDAETFARVQGMKTGTKRRTESSIQNLFGVGLLRCGRCGAAVILTNKGSAGVARRYLVCERAKEGSKECQYKALRYEPIEEAFLTNAAWLLHNAPAAGAAGQAIERMLRNTEGTLDILYEQKENTLRAIRQGRAIPTLTKELAEIERSIEAEGVIRQDLLQRREAASSKVLSQKIAELETILTTSPLDRRNGNALLRQIFKTITLDYSSGSLLFTWQHAAEDAPADSLIVTFPEAFNEA